MARFTANDPQVRAYSLQKRCARWTSVRTWREDFRVVGGREGVETDACRRPDDASSVCARRSTIYASTPGIRLRLQVRVRGEAERTRVQTFICDDRSVAPLRVGSPARSGASNLHVVAQDSRRFFHTRQPRSRRRTYPRRRRPTCDSPAPPRPARTDIPDRARTGQLRD